MVIYIDIIVLINFFIDLILLLSVDILLKRNAKFRRIVFSSLIGSLSTLLLFKIDGNFTLFLYKLVISVLMVVVAFKYESFSYFKDNLVWLYIISIILGGSLYLFSDHISLSNNGLVFEGNGLKINFILLIFIGPLALYKYLKNVKNYQITYSNYYDIVIYYDDVSLKGTGFLDTGNVLRDPYFNRPIVLVNKELIKGDVNTFLVPYYTVNHHDLLEVFKPNKIIVNNKCIKNVLIGLSDVNLDGVKIILNKEAL